MTSVSSFQRTNYGRLYHNPFSSADGTTKYNELGAPVWSLTGGVLRHTMAAPASAQGDAAVDLSTANMLVFTSTRFSNVGDAHRGGAVVRLTDASNSYRIYMVANTGTVVLQKRVAAAETTLTSAAGGLPTTGTFYGSMLHVSGGQLTGWFQIGTTITVLSAGDTSLTTGNYGGVITRINAAAMTHDFDVLGACTSNIITVNGLLEGQKFKITKSGIVVGTSAAAAGGIATLNLTSSGVTDIPPYDSIQLTDTDGATVLPEGTYSASSDIWGGDIYQAVVSSFVVSNFPPIAPLTFARPHVFLTTDSGKVYPASYGGEISPSSANSLGSFRLIVPDPTGEISLDFPKHKLTWVTVHGTLGYKTGVVMKGFVDQPLPVSMARGRRAIQLAGRSRGAYLALRGYLTNTSYTSTTPDAIVKAQASSVPELQFGNSILPSSVTLSNYTGFGGRNYWDVDVELAMLASLPNQPWGVWGCTQDHLGESNVNVHFGPVKREASLVPIVQAYSYRLMSPKDFRQLVTYVRVAYDSSGTMTPPWSYYTLNALGPPADSAYSASFNGTSSVAKCWASRSLDVGGNKVVTANGNAQINAAGTAITFDGAGDTLSVPDNPDWWFGAGKFTIKFKATFTALPAAGNYNWFMSQSVDANNAWYWAIRNIAGTYHFKMKNIIGGSADPDFEVAIDSLSTGVEYEFCFVRDGGNYYFFKDGVKQGATQTSAVNFPDLAASLMIGGDAAVWAIYHTGTMREIVIEKGTALYTGNYTVSSSPYTPNRNTVLYIPGTGAAASTTIVDRSKMGFTFLTWMTPSGAATQPIFTYDTGAAVGLNLWQAPTFADLQLNLVPTSGSTQTVAKTSVFTADTPYRVAVTYDGVYARLYVAGVEVASGYAPNLTLQTTYNLLLGKRETAAATYYAGTMDNVELLPYPMTPTEVLEDYQGLRKRGGSVLDLRFEEGSGNQTEDYSGHGNRAILSNVTFTANSQVPNSQARFGVIPAYFERTYAGLNEATAFAKAVLRQLGDPVQFVQATIPLDMRYNDGQMVDVLIPGIRGRAMLQNVNHVVDPAFPRTELVLVYQAV